MAIITMDSLADHMKGNFFYGTLGFVAGLLIGGYCCYQAGSYVESIRQQQKMQQLYKQVSPYMTDEERVLALEKIIEEH